MRLASPRNIPVIPLLVDDAAMASATALPERLQRFAFRNGMESDTGKDFRFHIERLIRDIEQKLATAGATRAKPAEKRVVVESPEIQPCYPACRNAAAPARPPPERQALLAILLLCGVAEAVGIYLLSGRESPRSDAFHETGAPQVSPDRAKPEQPEAEQPAEPAIQELAAEEPAAAEPTAGHATAERAPDGEVAETVSTGDHHRHGR